MLGASRDRRRCPCGSGKLRRTCDPRVIVPCATPGCPNFLHLTCNRAKWCTVCRVERARAKTTERQRRRRQRLRDAALADQLELERETP